MLLEIERVVDRFIKMFETAQVADQTLVNQHTAKIRNTIRTARTKKRLEEQETILVAERARKLDERMKREVVKGIKKWPARSEKAATKKKEEKKQDLTQEEIDHNKYLGQLTQVEEKKTN